MLEKITYLNFSEFVSLATFEPSRNKCIFSDLPFEKERTVEPHQIKDLLNICHQYGEKNAKTLIIRDSGKLTLWIEEKNSNLADRDRDPHKSHSQGTPTKTITKRYRGQVYEETVIDLAAVQQLSQQNKPRRKYRGQYVD